MTRLEKRRAIWKKAMPDVQKLVLIKVMADKAYLQRKINALRKEAETLSRKL